MNESAAPSGAIHIALTFDDKFWAPAYATMRSICMTTLRRGDLVFHLCHQGLTLEHRADLDAIAEEFGANLKHYDLDANQVFTETVSRLRYTHRLTYLTYARLFLDRLIDPAIRRLIYIDCDFLVLAPIEKLTEIDLQGFPIGAVKTTPRMRPSNRITIRDNPELFDPAEPYFNAGLMVIDMPSWRKAEVLATVQRVVEEGIHAGGWTSQQYLNLAFQRNWLQIDWRWNAYASRSDAIERVHPKAVHYIMHAKPWFLTTRAAHKRLYRHAMTRKLYYRYMRYRWRHYWHRLGR